MNCVFTGQQFQAFLSDPSFWGQGQSYENLRLLINGVPFGYAEFEDDWDPQDLADNDYVQILDGVWHGHGFCLPSHQMACVIEYWLGGQKPERIHKPNKIVPSSEIASVIFKPQTVHGKVKDEVEVLRPVFKI